MRIVSRLLVWLPLLWVEGIWAVDCQQSDYNLGIQAEVDALGAASCDNISGNLAIWHSTITNLDGLANITSVGGDVYLVGNDAIINLDGLVNLTSVGGYLEISNNDALTNCQAVALVLGWPSGPPDDSVGGVIDIDANGAGCNSVDQVLASVSGERTQPVITQAPTSRNIISLGFNLSTTTDTAFPIAGYSARCLGSDIDVAGAPVTDLIDNTPIEETLTVAGYDPTSVLSSIEIDVDITHSDPRRNRTDSVESGKQWRGGLGRYVPDDSDISGQSRRCH